MGFSFSFFFLVWILNVGSGFLFVLLVDLGVPDN